MKLEGGQVKANKRGQVGNGRQTTTVKRKKAPNCSKFQNLKVDKKWKLWAVNSPLFLKS